MTTDRSRPENLYKLASSRRCRAHSSSTERELALTFFSESSASLPSEGRHCRRKNMDRMEAMASRGEFWAGMRVLAIDANHDSLKSLVAALRQCDYNVTPVTDAKTALQTLWEAKEPFGLVIGEADMPDINGVELLRYIKIQTGVPVIAVSANSDTEAVMKGIEHGVCEYLLKPVRVEQLRNIWQHALRRKPAAWNVEGDANQRPVQSAGIAAGDPGPKSTSLKNSERIIAGDADSDKNMGLEHSKRPRVIWTKELHDKFLVAYHKLGKDAVPKKICEMMNVDYISRLTVASHLQKYRVYLRGISDPKARAPRRWNSAMSNLESSRHYDENRIRRPSSVVASSSSNNPFTTRPIEPRKNLGKKKAVKHGARSHKSKDHAKVLCGILLNTNQGKACSQFDYSFENMPDEEMLQPVNQHPVQPPELVNQPSILMNTPAFFQKQDAPATNLLGALGDASKYFPNNLAGNYNPWQTALPSMFPGPSQVNIPEISQLTSFAGTSSSQMPMVTNEMSNPIAAFISSSTPVASFNQQMAPFNIESNTISTEILNGNFAPGSTSSSMSVLTQMVNALSINSALPDVETDDNFFEWMLNGEDAADTLPVQEGNNGLGINSTFPDVETDDNFFEWMINGEDAADTLLVQEGNGPSINPTLLDVDDNFFDSILNGEDAADTIPVQEGSGHQQALDVVLPNDNNDYISFDEFLSQHAVDPAVMEEMLAETDDNFFEGMLNGEDAADTLPVQEGTGHQQALLLNDDNDYISFDEFLSQHAVDLALMEEMHG